MSLFPALQVIGDKKGAGTARNLANDLTTLNKLQETVGIPVKFIHVIRNPFDNIATQMLRVLKVRDHARNPNFRVSKKCPYLLYRQECFTGKYTARKIHTKLHPGPEWRIFHILTSEDIDDVISRSFTVVCVNSR